MRFDLYIKKYDRIRKVLEMVYTYGFFSRTDFERQGVNKNSYDKENQRLYELFAADGDLTSVVRQKKRYPQFQRPYFKEIEKGPYRSYLIRAFSPSDLEICAILLSVVSKQGKTVSEACTAVETLYQSGEAQMESTVRRRLCELHACGYLQQKGQKYSPAAPPFDGITGDALQQLYGYLDLFVQAFSPRVAGCYLKQSLRLIMKRRGIPILQSAFLVRHRNEHNIPNEEILYKLLDCCHLHKTARIECKLPQRGVCTVEVLPVKMRLDAKLGRWYLFAVLDGTARILRVTDISSVAAGGAFDHQSAREQTDAAFADSLISFRKEEGAPFALVLELCFQNHPHLKRQFLREMPMGNVVQRDGRTFWQACINDPVELIPWLRCYASDIRFVTDTFGLREHLLNGLREMCTSYGTVS